jgi:serine/threonine protein kinase
MTPAADHDQRLADLLADLSACQRRGEPADIDAAATRHPELADELRQLWAAAQFADLLAGSSSATRTQPPSSGHSSRLPPAVVPLPSTFGDFELTEVIGRGGMGVVYKARQKSLGRTVALKMVRDGSLASPEQRARFKAEAESAARLEHPNIVPVYGVGDHDGHAYYCMPYVDGPTLARRLAGGPLPPREAARLIATLARAVHFAHEHGVIHRDLKPSNILLAGSTPKVADFGLAKRVAVEDGGSVPTGPTQSGAIIGTPSYMPPEQASGGRGPLGPAADVYALGAILYECLTGRPPFVAASAVETVLMVLEQEPVEPRLLNPGVDRDLEMICLKCLQKPVALRYGSAEALARDLEAFLAGEPISAQPSGLGQLLGRLLRQTHHAAVLENWGVLWMWHSLAIFLLCAITQAIAAAGVFHHHVTYLLLWSVGLVTWGGIFWQLRRRGGPVLFVERQIAHAWAAGICASISMFVIEVLAGMPPLTLSPGIAVAAGMIFVVKAGSLSGEFYVWAAALFATAFAMTQWPAGQVLLFGAVSAVSFFVPGLKYYRQRQRTLAARARG